MFLSNAGGTKPLKDDHDCYDIVQGMIVLYIRLFVKTHNVKNTIKTGKQEMIHYIEHIQKMQ